jgi:hypothetical protein
MSRPRRRRIEIYFILYLVALVLLLPDGPPHPPGPTVPADLRLDLQPERVRLEAQIVRDTAGGLRLRSLDSVNVIRYSGDVNDLQVQARIEDVASGQVLSLEPGSTSSLFELQAQPERQAVVFRWHPVVTDGQPRILRVTINGSASPSGLRSGTLADADALPPGLRINGSTQFVLSTVVTDETTAPSLTFIPQVDTLRIFQSDGRGPLGAFWLEAARDVVSTTPLQPWSMRMSMGGADPLRDLDGMPQVRTNMNGVEVERYLDSAARMLVVRGRAPRSGSYTVTVQARRRDGQGAEASFLVQAMPMAGVNVVDVMYPGIEYVIDPQLPDVPGVQAAILDGQREVVSVRAGKLRWTPKLTDTSRAFSFVRLVDGQQTEAPQSIRVRSFPPPEIRDVKDFGSGDRKKVIVKFYGDRNRDRPTLEVTDGNARPPRKLFGNLHQADPGESPAVTWIEEFEVSRKDPSRPFAFVLQARDPQGRLSALWKE